MGANAFNRHQIFTLDTALVEVHVQDMFSSQTCDFSTIKLQCTKLSYYWYPKVLDLPFLPLPLKIMLIKKRYLGLSPLWDSNALTFQGIFAIQDVDRSTKPVVVVLVMSLHIVIGKFVTSIARAVSIRREITVTIVFTFLVLLSRLD